MTMAWCFPEEATQQTEAVFDSLAGEHEIFVPVLWPYEVSNVLLGAVRRQRISSAKAKEFIDDLESLDIRMDDGTGLVWETVYTLAERHRLTTYDAAYLELAQRKQLPLASLDGQLNSAAREVGIEMIEA
jgi:predicted nucleic acid-binding protein